MKRSTIADRRQLRVQLGEMFNAWLRMSDDELLQAAREEWPAITNATREECIKFLTLHHVDKMVG